MGVQQSLQVGEIVSDERHRIRVGDILQSNRGFFLVIKRFLEPNYGMKAYKLQVNENFKLHSIPKELLLLNGKGIVVPLFTYHTLFAFRYYRTEGKWDDLMKMWLQVWNNDENGICSNLRKIYGKYTEFSPPRPQIYERQLQVKLEVPK